MSSVQQAISGETPAPRPIFKYKVPKTTDPNVESIGLVALRADEEMMASRRVNSANDLMYELAKQSVVQVNGQPVSIASGLEEAWQKFSPKLRSLVVVEYRKNNVPDDKDAEDFSKSQEVILG